MKRIAKALALVILLTGCLSDQKPTSRGINSILGGEIANGYQPNDTNIRVPETVQSVEIDGRQAIRLLVRYEDEGGAADWFKFGEPGQGQRIQFLERRPSKVMQLGGEYWYRVSFRIEPFPATRGQIVGPFDIKPTYTFSSGKHPGAPLFGLHLNRGDFYFFDSFGSRFECGEYRNPRGTFQGACDRQENWAHLGRQGAFFNRWIDLVFHVKWANDETGLFRYWVNGRNHLVFRGNTAKGADDFEFKFGAYRHHLRGPQPPLAISYSHVVRAGNCEELGVSNCAALEVSGKTPGRRNLTRFHKAGYFPELTNLRRDPTNDGALQ